MFENLQLENFRHFCLINDLNQYFSVMVWVSCYKHFRHLCPQVCCHDFPLPVFFFFCVHLCLIWSVGLLYVSVSAHQSCVSCLSGVCCQPSLVFPALLWFAFCLVFVFLHLVRQLSDFRLFAPSVFVACQFCSLDCSLLH